jgi:hypothetical protein
MASTNRNDTSDLRLLLNQLNQLNGVDHMAYRWWDFLEWFPTKEDEEASKRTPRPLKKWCVDNVDCEESRRLRRSISFNIQQLCSLCDASSALKVRDDSLNLKLHDTNQLGVPDHDTKFKILSNGYVIQPMRYHEVTAVHVVEDLRMLIVDLQTALTATRKGRATEEMIKNTVDQCIASVDAFIAYIMRDFYPRSPTGQQ